MTYVERQLQRLLQVTTRQTKMLMESKSSGSIPSTDDNIENMKQVEQSLHEMATKLQHYASQCPNPHGLLHG